MVPAKRMRHGWLDTAFRNIGQGAPPTFAPTFARDVQPGARAHCVCPAPCAGWVLVGTADGTRIVVAPSIRAAGLRGGQSRYTDSSAAMLQPRRLPEKKPEHRIPR